MIVADEEVVRSDQCGGRDVGDVKNLSPDSSAENLVRSIVSEMMKRGLDDGEEWDKIQSLAWCRTELGLGNVLLRKLRAWETCHEYSQDYFVLDNSSYDDFLLLKDLAGFRAGAFIDWAQNVGLDYNDICAVSGITTFTQHEKPEPPKKRAPQKSLTIAPAQKRMAVPQVPNLARTCPKKFYQGNITRLSDDRKTSEGVPNSAIIKDVVHRIVVAILDRVSAGQAPARRAVENAMSTSWCMEALGIMSPLIRHCITPIGADAYVYECIDREKYPTYYICRFLTQLRIRELLSWAREAGIKTDELADSDSTPQNDSPQEGENATTRAVEMPDRRGEVEGPLTETLVHPKPLSEIRREIAASKMMVTDIEPQVKLGRLKDLILKNYPRGIVLNNATTALLEKESGKPLDEVDLNRVRLEMFARADGTLLYPEMVMGMDGLERMKNRAKELLAEYGMFAYGCLWNEFAGEMRNLLDERDFARFFDRFFARDVGMVYASRDRLGKMMCLGEIHDFPETIGEKVRSVLAECGDAVSIDNLLVQLPYLSREVIELVGQEVLHDVVVFDVEGERYLKLLESYFLPDDFSRVVSDFVAITEASQGVVSIVLLESEFESRYGEGFRVNYALEDESVFKQVVLMSFRGRVHDWNRDMFLPYGKRGNSNVAEMFLQSHQDLFHEEEFFKYALESRGLHNTGMLILTFLRKHCIRMSKEWWISLDGFDQKFELSDEQYDAIGHILNDAVGNGRFKSIIELGEDVYEQLPVLQSGEKTYPWNPYVLTSIAVQKVRNACVVNDEPSPYTVTAMILPANSGEIGDVVDYVLRTFPKGFFVDAEAAFDYLRVNHIRLTKTKKLIAKIKALLEMP